MHLCCCFRGRRKELQSPRDLPEATELGGPDPEESSALPPCCSNALPENSTCLLRDCYGPVCITTSRNPGGGEAAWPIPTFPASPVDFPRSPSPPSVQLFGSFLSDTQCALAPPVPREGAPAAPHPRAAPSLRQARDRLTAAPPVRTGLPLSVETKPFLVLLILVPGQSRAESVLRPPKIPLDETQAPWK